MDRLIFVSCGQRNKAEIEIGSAVKEAIDVETGFAAYFAHHQHEAASLSDSIMVAIRECSGAVVIMHARDKVARGVRRSSLFVNQELAMIAFKQHCLGARTPVLAFRDSRASLEGLETLLQVNPQPIPAAAEIGGQVRQWLRSNSFGWESNSAVFEERWQLLTAFDRSVLKAIIEEGGENVQSSFVKQRLKTADPSWDPNVLDTQLRERCSHLFQNVGFIEDPYQPLSSLQKLTIRKAFEPNVRRAIIKWANEC